MPTKDADCKSHGANVEDDAGDEEGEETEESLKKLKFLDNKVFHFSFHVPFIFFGFLCCLFLEGDELSRDLDEKEETGANGNELRVSETPPGSESKNQHRLREGLKKG